MSTLIILNKWPDEHAKFPFQVERKLLCKIITSHFISLPHVLHLLLLGARMVGCLYMFVIECNQPRNKKFTSVQIQREQESRTRWGKTKNRLWRGKGTFQSMISK